MTNPEVYHRITCDQLKNILRGDDNTEPLLMDERHQCLRESGQVLIDKFGGKPILRITLESPKHFLR